MADPILSLHKALALSLNTKNKPQDRKTDGELPSVVSVSSC